MREHYFLVMKLMPTLCWEERMAETPEKVHQFLLELLEKAKPAAQREFKQLEKFADELDGIKTLQKMGWGLLFREVETRTL